jgi:hypothetical protein
MMPRNQQKVIILVAIILVVLVAGGAVYYFVIRQSPGKNVNANSLAPATLNQNANTAASTAIVNVAKPSIDPAKDTDKDGLENTLEEQYGSDPNKADTDGDGVDDYIEVMNCYNPAGDGRMTVAIFQAYCVKTLALTLAYMQATFQDKTEKICTVYEPFAEKSIQAAVTGNQALMNTINTQELDSACQKVDTIAGNGEDNSQICMMLSLMSYFCPNVNSLKKT